MIASIILASLAGWLLLGYLGIRIHNFAAYKWVGRNMVLDEGGEFAFALVFSGFFFIWAIGFCFCQFVGATFVSLYGGGEAWKTFFGVKGRNY